MKTTRYARTSALPAIAAVLALSSTSALAQEAQPVTVAPPSPVAADPAPVIESTPVTTETPVETTEPVVSEPAATPVAAKPVKRATRAAAVKAAPPAPKSAASQSAPAASTAAPAPVADPVIAMATTPTAKPAPVAPVADESAKSDNTVPIAAGGALAFLALGGAAVAMTRRRRHEEDEELWVEEEPVEGMAEPEAVHVSEPVAIEQPLILGPSAFAWGNERASYATPAGAEPRVEAASDDDRLPGESWVERAYRGPTVNNPSVSLRNRLRRAAFFDKRERDVAAGHAEPVDMTAGLPDAMVEEKEREREFA